MSSFSSFSRIDPKAKRKKRDPLQDFIDPNDIESMLGPVPTEPLRPLPEPDAPTEPQSLGQIASATPTTAPVVPEISVETLGAAAPKSATPAQPPQSGGTLDQIAADAASQGLPGGVTAQQVHRTRQKLSSDIRHEEAQNLQQRRALDAQRQQAIREGRPEDAAAIMAEIQRIANSTRDDRENLRNLLQAERSVTPAMSPERRQQGRDQLNAQLPGILESMAADNQEAVQQRRDRLAEIGGDAIRLETGLDPSKFDPEARAQFALSADPSVIDQTTRGVGLPPAPGGDGLKRVEDLISDGGVDFGPESDRVPVDPDAVQAAMAFMGNTRDDQRASQEIRDSGRAVAVGQARADQAQVNETLRSMGIDPIQSPEEIFGPPAPTGGQQAQSNPIPSGGAIMEDAARRIDYSSMTPEMAGSVRGAITGISDGSIASTIRENYSSDSGHAGENKDLVDGVFAAFDSVRDPVLRRNMAIKLKSDLGSFTTKTNPSADELALAALTDPFNGLAAAGSLLGQMLGLQSDSQFTNDPSVLAIEQGANKRAQDRVQKAFAPIQSLISRLDAIIGG